MKTQEDGFTVIEALVTVIVAALFVIMLVTLFTAISVSSSTTRNRADASDLAYANLRNYVYNGAVPPAFTCSTSNDETANSSAAGTSITGVVSVDSSSTTLPQPVTYQVVLLAPFGCSGANLNTPILIKSTVTYGSKNQTVVHSSLVGY